MTFQYFTFLNFLILIQQLKGDLVFLVPSFSNSSNIGFGVNVPYFWDIAKDKDITFTPRILPRNETLYLAEYRQNFYEFLIF